MKEREQEVDDVHGREEDVDDEVAGMKVLVPENSHYRDLQKPEMWTFTLVTSSSPFTLVAT